MKRLHNLDYLRGLAAFGIMIYHYSMWSFGKSSAETFLGRVGVYGVSIFYVLSGLTLFYVYYDKLTPQNLQVGKFAKKRFFRIFPLLWFVTFCSIAISRHLPDFTKLFLNLTGLFGLVSWDSYFSTGVWSIGNELVFYLFFPFFILFAKSSKILFGILSAVIFGIYLYFAFKILNPSVPITQQWRNYVNPLNQVALFLSGFLLGYFFRDKETGNAMAFSLLLIGLLTFVFYPGSGDAIVLVTGINRIVFTICCLLICFGFYKITYLLPNIIHKPLTFLGEASYSVYLLHPLVYTVCTFLLKHAKITNGIVAMAVCIPITLVASYFVYTYLEKYFMKLGKK